jgi:hypothetical protein
MKAGEYMPDPRQFDRRSTYYRMDSAMIRTAPVWVLEYETEYKGEMRKFSSGGVAHDQHSLKIKVLDYIDRSSGDSDGGGTTTIEIHEDEWGELLGYHFDLGFLAGNYAKQE